MWRIGMPNETRKKVEEEKKQKKMKWANNETNRQQELHVIIIVLCVYDFYISRFARDGFASPANIQANGKCKVRSTLT